jgi:superfamily II DNA/RNA helicase
MELQPIYEKLQIQEMNQMQKSTYQASENEQDIILLSPTGSGKTLAFCFLFLEIYKKNFWNSSDYSGSGKRIGIANRTSFQKYGNRF